jgi:hypothetical protein
MPLHEIDDILNGMQALGLAPGHLDIELLFNLDFDVRDIQAVQAELIDEGR